jgi:hypothetical protein
VVLVVVSIGMLVATIRLAAGEARALPAPAPDATETL